MSEKKKYPMTEKKLAAAEKWRELGEKKREKRHLTADRLSAVPPPWSLPVTVAKIPEPGQHLAFEADAAQLVALAQLAGLREVAEARATFNLRHAGGDAISAVGRVRGRISQTCVVTLEPVENLIDEAIDVMFVPPSQGAPAAQVQSPVEGDDEIPDPPEPIVGGVIDLGKLAMDMLFLGIDPYPRKPGVEFVPPALEIDPDEHPFAGLKALKSETAANGKTRKGD